MNMVWCPGVILTSVEKSSQARGSSSGGFPADWRQLMSAVKGDIADHAAGHSRL